MLHSERINCQPFMSGNIRISTSLFPNGRQIAETSFFLLELKIFIEETKKEKAHKCLKPKLRNYQQNRVKRFVINQENLNYQSSVWRNEPTSESANY
ncbi:hypothetical protein Anas_12955 [Armadillidium nasatum]|uniref:Uncharacterized protein n=1 Tax=Armadillidium nasatum TaxID=96803 RepID=A0A5N5T116_9CRUS|nr:hypothetical protein Anas_13057 [Armadillidium nasatum]KAB7498227.1 hypothetical protein Anas_14528 [Armadillidium nasatum]KAB7499521.1 hypothetical protein Anas_14350 [Armadillidium nasatum]KAB7500153.1 hypothetical protein Anas_13981 [Armadillidium nasatum]KAB7501548.1 hypothetical protein Anas_14249 [Armadillidium nasatum]